MTKNHPKSHFLGRGEIFLEVLVHLEGPGVGDFRWGKLGIVSCQRLIGVRRVIVE